MVLPAAAAAVWLALRAPTAGSTAVAGIYGFTIVLMFCLSSLFHFRVWADRHWWQLRRLDHTGIYLLIGGTYLAVAGLSLEGLVRIMLLLAVFSIILITLAYRWLPMVPVKGTTVTLFLAVGWFSVGASKWLWESLGVLGMLMLISGGLFYTAGAVVLALRKPNPSPEYFGYHEVWHIAVIGGVICHYFVVAFVIF